MRQFVAGLVLALVALAVAGFAAVETGRVPARADVAPGALEKWAANTALNATIRREAPQPPYPFSPSTASDFHAAADLYVQNCAVCHGTASGTPTAIADGFSMKAPQFAKHGVDDDPEGVIYWKIEHGIRFTAMPAFDKSLDEKSIWQLTYFLKHLPELPPEAKAVWENPTLAAPATPAPTHSAAPSSITTT